jgi:iron complex transport system substrate-binding protein
MRVTASRIFFLIISLLLSTTSSLALEVVDDVGRTVTLEKPAQRIISLAPHVTENLFAAGVGHLIVGAVNYSDYPEQAKSIPQVGGYNNFNIELILASKPDLVIGWKEGNQKQQVEQLINLGLTVYISDPLELEDIARNIQHFGILSAEQDSAAKASNDFIKRLTLLRDQYSNRREISVFYQAWNHPLLTVNNQQFIGRIIKLCSGKNVFAELDTLTPQVSIEAVLTRNPSVIIASGMGEARPEWLDDWKQWSFIDAVKYDNLFFVRPDIIQRHTPRLLDGAQKVCDFLQQIRDKEI